MAVNTYDKNIRRKSGRIFIPKARFKPGYTVEIKYSGDSTYTDITWLVDSVTTTHASKIRLDSFTVSLDNYNGRFKNKIFGGEHIRVKAGYDDASTYTTMINARLEKDSYKFNVTDGYTYTISGRAFPEFNEKKITVSFDDALIEDIFEEVISNYSELSFTKPGITTDRVTQRFQDQTGLSILRNISDQYELEFYIDPDGVVHLFLSEDNQHTDVAIVMGQNLMSMENWERDWKQVKNRIKVHGKQTNFVQYYKIANDTASQSQFWIKEADIYDSTVDTNKAAIDRAAGELTYNLNIDPEGRFQTIGMPEAIPGHMIYVSIPYILDEYVTIRSFSHRFTKDGGWSTHFSLNKEARTLPHLFVERDKVSEGLRPVELDKQTDGAIVLDFKDTTVSYISVSDTEILSEALYITDGNTSGTVTTSLSFPGATTAKNTAKFVLKADGLNLEACTFSISNNSGLDSISVTFYQLGTELDFATSSNDHKITVNLADTLQGNKPKLVSVGLYLINT